MKKPENCPPVTVLICTLNEEESIPHFIAKIPEWIDEIILVDGHSSDGTVEVARKLCPRIKIFYQPGQGKGDAIKYGVKNSAGEIIVTLDADGATNPDEILDFINPLLNGYDFAKGSRFLKGRPKMPLRRQFGNWVLATASNILAGTRYTDVCSGYNAFWKKAFQKLPLRSNGFNMEQEMNVKIKKVGLKVIEIACIDRGRIGGTSKTKEVQQGLIDLFTIIRESFRA
ncbi:MAG: glycosyltransferase family 2 protein [Dehalococcoidales bacterium]|nr:glycosyltransferase family 2 protein [Dehalococcoidales bacterium]